MHKNKCIKSYYKRMFNLRIWLKIIFNYLSFKKNVINKTKLQYLQ